MEKKSWYLVKNTLLKINFIIYYKSINIDKVYTKRIVLSNKELHDNNGSYKHFIGNTHKGNSLSSPLCIKFPQMNAYPKYFDRYNKCMNHFS